MPKKSLGQHWLRDIPTLTKITDVADLQPTDTVLEIGPGLGTLTSVLLRGAKEVVAVEFDENLARKLPAQFPGKNLKVIREDFLTFDLAQLPKNYKVVANVPYYITAKIVHKLLTAGNPPLVAVLLVQKEVAQRLVASPGDMSVVGLSAQIFAEVSLGDVVTRELFLPPPKVDSQVVVLCRRDEPLVSASEQEVFFRVAKAGFSEKRKKLRSSLAGGLNIDKGEAEKLLRKAGISPDVRAEELSIANWQEISKIVNKL